MPKILLSQNFSNPNMNNYNYKIKKNKMFLSQSDESKKEAINIVMKIKEKAINVAINRMNFYKKENEILKKELYKNDDYTNNLGLEDYSNENKKKIKLLSDEIKILNNQLEEHQKCIYERNLMNQEYSELKKNLKEIKKNIKELKDAIKEKQKEAESSNTGNIETVEDATSNNNFSPRSNNTKTIGCPNPKKISRNIIPHLSLNKSNISNLPVIYSPTNNYKYDKNILSNEFYAKLKKHYEGRDNEYEILIDKIKETENSRNFIENKHKNEIKQFNSQILTLDEQFKILNNEGKGNGANIRVLKYRLNTIKNEAKHCLNQIQKLKVKLDFAVNISKEKDHEIFLLKGQINSIKNKKINIIKKKNDEMNTDSEESEKDKNIKNTKESKNIKNKNKKNSIKNDNIEKDSKRKDTKKNIIKSDSSKKKIDNKDQNKKEIVNIKPNITSNKSKKKFKLNLKDKKK